MLISWFFTLVPFLAVCLAGDVLFSCDFKQDLCGMVENKSNSFPWHIGTEDGLAIDGDSRKPHSHYLYARKTHTYGKTFSSSIATPALGYQGRVFLDCYMALTGHATDRFHHLSVSPPDIRDIMWTATTTFVHRWTHMELKHTLLCRNEYIEFSLFVNGSLKEYDDKANEVYIQIADLTITKGCGDGHACPAEWSTWSSWGECDMTCGQGRRYRQRFCDNPLGGDCEGDRAETKDCIITLECPAIWVAWSSWSVCDVTCGKGMKERARVCENLANIDPCEGTSIESTPCVVKCKVCVANCVSCEANTTVCDEDGCADSFIRTLDGMCLNDSSSTSIAAVGGETGGDGIGSALLISLVVIGLLTLVAIAVGAVIAVIRRRRKMSQEKELIRESLEQAQLRAQAQHEAAMTQGPEEPPATKTKNGSANGEPKAKKGRRSAKGKRKKISKPAEAHV